MKRILTLIYSPPGLADYLAGGADPENWDRFYNCPAGAFRELHNALAERQHRLCGYCEIRLQESNMQVEHVIPKNCRTGEPARALDYTNLIACCLGVARGKKGRNNESCGQAKNATNDPNFVDPRNLPALPSLFRVELRSGKMMADAEACDSAGFCADDVERTIAILGLNAPRLQQERLNCLNHLDEIAGKHLSDSDFEEFLEIWAHEELLPDDKGILPDFFTTRRSYFAPEGERVLAEPPQAWI